MTWIVSSPAVLFTQHKYLPLSSKRAYVLNEWTLDWGYNITLELYSHNFVWLSKMEKDETTYTHTKTHPEYLWPRKILHHQHFHEGNPKATALAHLSMSVTTRLCVIMGKHSPAATFLVLWKIIITFKNFSKPADTIVIRSLSCSGNNCSFSSLNHLFGMKGRLWMYSSNQIE